MTLQAKLTLGTVLLATVIVAVISAVDLGNIMDLQFESALRQANRVADTVVSDVRDVNSHPEQALPEALASDRLAEQLKTEATYSKEIFEVAVVDEHDEILADSIAERRGEKSQRYGDLDPLVKKTGWYRKLQVLRGRSANYYQVEREMGPPTIFVRVVVEPAFIRKSIAPDLELSARNAIVSVIGAICLTFLFSAFAFRPLPGCAANSICLPAANMNRRRPPASRRRRSLHHVFQSEPAGERLRGAQYEVSDLRGNIDRLLQDLEDAVLIFNRESRLVFASGSVRRFLGRERDALSGESIADIFPPSPIWGS